MVSSKKTPSSIDSNFAGLPELPGEQFEFSLDAKLGEINPTNNSRNVVILTSQRIIHRTQKSGKQNTSVMPLKSLNGIEVAETSKPVIRIAQGALLLGIGILLGVTIWILLGSLLLTIIAGGLPTIMGIYLITGSTFPDEQGAIQFHSDGFNIRMPLLTSRARQDAYLIAHHAFKLITTSNSQKNLRESNRRSPQTRRAKNQ